VLLLGGRDGGPGTAVWAMPTSGASDWLLLPATGAPPSLGNQTRACYDTRRDRLVVWDPPTSTLWKVTLDGSLHWTGRAVPGPGPGSTSSACAYDAERSRMLVFGGYNAAQYVHADVWALAMEDTATWRLLMPSGSGPTGRMSAAAIVDPATDRLIVSGGRDFTGPMTPRGDVWALSLAGPPAWTLLFGADTTASLRWAGHAAVLDSTRRRMLVLGGQGNGSRAQSGQAVAGDGQGAPLADVAAEAWLVMTGKVVSVADDLVQIKTDAGEVIPFEGRPLSFAAEQGFSLKVGDSVTLDGYDENGQFKIGKVTNVNSGASVMLRDASGRPGWAGRGRQGKVALVQPARRSELP